MLNFPVKYKITFVKKETGLVQSDHKNKRLLISEDIKPTITDDGKLRLTFKSQEPPKKSSFFGIPLFSKGKTDSGCSITISDPSRFNYCFQENGKYFLSGAKVAFDGTDGDDNLIIHGSIDSQISMGDGNDTVEIEGISDRKYTHLFKGNLIDTGKGEDNVKVNGDFAQVYDNGFYLGKGNDNFSAEINPDNDATTELDYNRKLPEYINSVLKNRIYATDGEKGFFEKNYFESKTYSANQFSEISSRNAITEGFDLYKYKLVPRNKISAEVKADKTKPSKISDREKYTRMYQLGSLRAMLFNDTEGQKLAFEAVGKYVESQGKTK